MDDVERSAHGYADAGWPVFPLARGDKLPAIPNPHEPGSDERGTCRGECGREGHGFKDATTDHATIERWWHTYRGANVAIATGAPGPTVLDVDHKDGQKPGRQSLDRLLAADLVPRGGPVISTPTGGQHWYFKGDEQPNAALKTGAIDLRGAGGYVAAPPSKVAGR